MGSLALVAPDASSSNSAKGLSSSLSSDDVGGRMVRQSNMLELTHDLSRTSARHRSRSPSEMVIAIHTPVPRAGTPASPRTSRTSTPTRSSLSLVSPIVPTSASSSQPVLQQQILQQQITVAPRLELDESMVLLQSTMCEIANATQNQYLMFQQEARRAAEGHVRDRSLYEEAYEKAASHFRHASGIFAGECENYLQNERLRMQHRWDAESTRCQLLQNEQKIKDEKHELQSQALRNEECSLLRRFHAVESREAQHELQSQTLRNAEYSLLRGVHAAESREARLCNDVLAQKKAQELLCLEWEQAKKTNDLQMVQYQHEKQEHRLQLQIVEQSMPGGIADFHNALQIQLSARLEWHAQEAK
jgi:hypothetical protein